MTFHIQAAFTAGELSPSLYARGDLEQYKLGAKTINNFIIHAHGGVSNRAGTRFVEEAYDSSYKSRLIPFQFSTSQAYCVELSENKMRILKDGGIIIDGGNPVEVDTPWTASDLDDIDYAQSADVLYIVHPVYESRKISRTSHIDWTVDIIDFKDGPYASVSSFDWESQDIVFIPDSCYSTSVSIESPDDVFTASMVGKRIRLGYFDPEDIANIGWRIGKITGFTDARNITVDFQTYREVLGHCFVQNHRFEGGLAEWSDFSVSATIKFQPGLYARLIHGTGKADMRQEVSVMKNTNVNLVFDVANINGTVRVMVGTTTGAADLVTAISRTTAGVDIHNFNTGDNDKIYLTIDTEGSSNGQLADIALAAIVTNYKETNQWRVPAWTAEKGYPRTVTFFEQRLAFGSSVEEPQTLWLSRTGGFENFGFSSPIQDDDSFQFTLASRQLNDIRWLVAFSELLAGTSGAEWAISRGENATALTPTSIFARAQSYLGSADLKPIIIGNSILFVQRGGNSVQEMSYSLERDGYATGSLSVLSEHLFRGKQIVSWAYARNPDSIVWCVLNDGSLVGMTYMRDQNVWGWHRHESDGFFERVCVVPGDGINDDVYFLVRRTIDGIEKRYIEFLMPRIIDAATHNYYFVDCGLSYEGPETTVITGLDHLEGKEVVALANGSVVPRKTVNSGSIILDSPATLVHVGLPYVSDLRTLDVNFTDDLGTSQGRKRQVPKVTIKVQDTRGFWAGSNENNLIEDKIRDQSMGQGPIPLYTADREIRLDSGYNTSGEVLIRNVDPIPLTVLAVIPEIKLSAA